MSTGSEAGRASTVHQGPKTEGGTLAVKAIEPKYKMYVEDVAWKRYAMGNPATEDLLALPPPDSLPGLPNKIDEPSCTWYFDEVTRILRAKLKPGKKKFSWEAKELLQLMMERDDIAVIPEGHC